MKKARCATSAMPSRISSNGRRFLEKLAVLRSHNGQTPLAIVLGEFKAVDTAALGMRVWIKHMPDAPLLVASRAWERMVRMFAPLFEARDADAVHQGRLVMTALIRARREQTYEIDAASIMQTSAHWIPVEGAHELPLIDALVAAQRRFVKPLRYDARHRAAAHAAARRQSLHGTRGTASQGSGYRQFGFGGLVVADDRPYGPVSAGVRAPARMVTNVLSELRCPRRSASSSNPGNRYEAAAAVRGAAAFMREHRPRPNLQNAGFVRQDGPFVLPHTAFSDGR